MEGTGRNILEYLESKYPSIYREETPSCIDHDDSTRDLYGSTFGIPGNVGCGDNGVITPCY